jgi:hypothetical protein
MGKTPLIQPNLESLGLSESGGASEGRKKSRFGAKRTAPPMQDGNVGSIQQS